MFDAFRRTLTELLDSKKWIGSYVATVVACVLHLYFGLSIQDSLLLVSPIAIGVAGQAHVDAAKEKSAAPNVQNTVVNEPQP